MANSNFSFKIHDGFDFILEEKGNTFIALRKMTWGEKDYEPKYDIRKWYSSQGEAKAGKGVGLSEEGLDELVNILLSSGFGNTEEVLSSIKHRDDFEKSYDKIVKGIIFENEEDDTYYDPREVLFSSEEDGVF